MSLKKYQKKRRFSRTPEPAGKPRRSAGGLRFVIHKHAARSLHYDFRLELDGVLKSWAVPKGPSLNPKDKRLAMMVEDHPYDYKDFEGVIPEGNYGAGAVMIWDEGQYRALQSGGRLESARLLRQELAAGQLKIFLQGKKLAGGFALVKLGKYKGRPAENAWLLVKERDEYARDRGLPKDSEISARSGRSLEEIAAKSESRGAVWESDRPGKRSNARSVQKNLPDHLKKLLQTAPKSDMPKNVRPMLATLASEPFDRSGWLFEVKWDGFRTLAEVGKNGTRLYSRNLQPFTELFAPIAETLKQWGDEVLLDGEAVVVGSDGRPSFQLLQNYQNTGRGALAYMVFDLLYYQGRDLRPLKLSQRKQILRAVLPKTRNVLISDHEEETGREFFHMARRLGLEGVVAKDMDSSYLSGRRSRSWLKVKTNLRQEAVIAGFTRPRGSRQKFGSLVLGVYQNGDLVYIGQVGGGFGEQALSDVYGKLKALAVSKPPFSVPPKTNEPATWVKPALVCEVSFREWTADGHMRHPLFLGLRTDKEPKTVVREAPIAPSAVGDNSNRKFVNTEEVKLKVGGRTVPVTNLGKIYWPREKFTKGDLIAYYRAAADAMLPYLKDRPENLNRHPNGITGESFYQKDVDHRPPRWAKTKKIFSESNGKFINYLVCQDEATLVYMANLGCIEINPWNSRIGALDRPDYLVIDLDPEKISFEKVVEAAQAVRGILDGFQVPSFCKTSGATGLHVYVPLGARYDYDAAKQFAQLIAALAHSRLPDTTSLERSPSKRQKKVYLDFLQNRKGQTLAAAYSVRPRPGATVSMPLEWREVNRRLDPVKFTMKTALKRLDQKGDLWAPVLGRGADIKKVLEKMEDLA